jgi:hypothetical protein
MVDKQVTRNPSPWVDLIAFLGVLALGVILIAFGHTTAGSLATICAALGGLFALFRFHSAGGPPDTGERSGKPDKDPR